MAASENTAAQQLRKISECSICLNDFRDPRMLACIHTFCFECLERVGSATEKKPGDKMPCPLCRKEFTIPGDGISGMQKNFFMQDLMDVSNVLRQGTVSAKCDICKELGEYDSRNIPEATMRCLECQDNFCDRCSKGHQLHKLRISQKVITIGSENEEEIRQMTNVKFCNKHSNKQLDYYCADCKKIVCVSCFVESHKLHDCKDVTTTDEIFRQTIEKKAWMISTYLNEMLLIRSNKEKRKADFLKEIVDTEKEIHKRNQELKDMIDRCTKSLLDELSVIKSNHLKELQNQLEEIDTCCTVLSSFESYCTELRSKGSACDICSSVDQLIGRADDLAKDHWAFVGRPLQSVEVSFQATALGNILQNAKRNFLGKVEETKTESENNAIVIGIDDGRTISKNIMKINLRRPVEISTLEEIPTEMPFEAFAAVYCNTLYVTGIGDDNDEIWKYNSGSGWTKCASLVQGRRKHSAAFVDEVLYICGGYVDYYYSVLHKRKHIHVHSVEAFNAVTDKCTIVGKLVHDIDSAGNCVPYKSSLYIFGGSDKDDNSVSHIQVYNTKENTCTLISKPMPKSHSLMRAVLWGTSVILLGRETCFIFDLNMERWEEREQFKTDVDYFGLVLENERIFVIGGGEYDTDKDSKDTWKCRDDVRYVSLQSILDDEPVEWKIHAILPQPALVHACEKLTFLVS